MALEATDRPPKRRIDARLVLAEEPGEGTENRTAAEAETEATWADLGGLGTYGEPKIETHIF